MFRNSDDCDCDYDYGAGYVGQKNWTDFLIHAIGSEDQSVYTISMLLFQNISLDPASVICSSLKTSSRYIVAFLMYVMKWSVFKLINYFLPFGIGRCFFFRNPLCTPIPIISAMCNVHCAYMRVFAHTLEVSVTFNAYRGNKITSGIKNCSVIVAAIKILFLKIAIYFYFTFFSIVPMFHSNGTNMNFYLSL